VQPYAPASPPTTSASPPTPCSPSSSSTRSTPPRSPWACKLFIHFHTSSSSCRFRVSSSRSRQRGQTTTTQTQTQTTIIDTKKHKDASGTTMTTGDHYSFVFGQPFLPLFVSWGGREPGFFTSIFFSRLNILMFLKCPTEKTENRRHQGARDGGATLASPLSVRV
jgi:hypothetical protein